MQKSAQSKPKHPNDMTEIVMIFRLREKKTSIINVNLKKCPRQIPHPVIELKMELFTKIVNNFKL